MKYPFLKIAVKNLFSKPSTVLYPFVPVDVRPDYRGRIEYYPEKCINCGMCQKVCSPQAITTVEETTPDGKDIHFTFDLTSCTFCGTCEDFCEHGAIRLSQDFHMASEDVNDLMVKGTCHKSMPKGKLICNSNCIYCGLCAKKCPQEAITVNRAEKIWEVDVAKCTKCGSCVAACKKDALEFAVHVKKIVECDENLCIHCKLCVTNCPTGAISASRSNKSWSYDPDLCSHCSTCLDHCPKGALSIKAVVMEPEVKCDPETCIYCTLCEKKCPVGAISVDRAAKTWSIDKDVCRKCGNCVEKCPKKALTME